ncbi:MAG: HEPN domain-containing protein [Clostridiales bacterium]|nr:HEPN domain-containing protein [Clostridiales bacterium]
MENKGMLQEWLDFAEMDFLTAKHLYDNMYPKPLEIICYHCQQSIEKLLKGVLLSYGVTIKKTHDLGLLAEMLQEYVEIDSRYMEMCDDLTPYGVKIRYPQELCIEEYHVKKALAETEELYNWLRGLLKTEEDVASVEEKPLES